MPSALLSPLHLNLPSSAMAPPARDQHCLLLSSELTELLQREGKIFQWLQQGLDQALCQALLHISSSAQGISKRPGGSCPLNTSGLGSAFNAPSILSELSPVKAGLALLFPRRNSQAQSWLKERMSRQSDV